jgi:hypothetical protein
MMTGLEICANFCIFKGGRAGNEVGFEEAD